MKKSFIRAISVLLCAVILLSGAVCAFAKEDRETYTGKMLMAVNTDYDLWTCNDGLYSFDGSNINNSVKEQTAEKTASVKSAPDVIDDAVIASPEEYEEYLKAHKNEPQALIHNEYKVGDTKIINPGYKDNEGNEKMTVKCIYIGKDCTVWTQVFDDGSLYDTAEAAKEAADYFDSVHKAEEEIFGGKDLIDTDGDGKFAIISYDIDDALGIGGFQRNSDLVNIYGFIGKVFSPKSLKYGNNMDCVFLHGLPNESTIAHEYQHYLFDCNVYYNKTNYNYPPEYESFVTEGFSRCAEVIFGEIGVFSLSGPMERADETSLVKWTFDSDSYTIAGAFCSYLRNRYAILTNDKSGDFAGKGFFLEYHRNLEHHINKDNKLISMEIFGDILYPEDKYPELKNSADRARQLLIDFWKAVILREKTGIHSFNGENVVQDLYIEEELLAGMQILGAGMAKLYLVNSGKKADAVIKSKSDNIYFEALDIEGIREITFDYNYEEAPEPERVFLLNDDISFPSEDRDGFNLVGWSENKNAKEADYTCFDTIEAVGDTVYYAVWKEWPVLEEGTEYGREVFAESGFEFDAYFIPKETAYYSAIMRYCSVNVYNEDGDFPLLLCYEVSNNKGVSEATYHLIGGEKYSIHFFEHTHGLDADGSLGFSIVRETASRNLTFVTDGENFAEHFEGRTEYILPVSDGGYDKIFLGWSLKKNAKSPDYKAGELLKLTEDTTLYAVYKPNTVIIGDGEYKTGEDDIYIVFTPESSGTYLITCSEGGTFQIMDENHKGLGVFLGSCEGVFAAGHKYYFRFDDVQSFTVKKLSEKTETELKIIDKEGKELYTDKGKAFYTIPDIEPEDNYEGKLSGFSGLGGDNFNIGDTVFVLGEKKLRPNYDDYSCNPGETYGPEDTGYNRKDNRRYFFLSVNEKGLYRIKAKGGLAYYEKLTDIQENILWNNTDDGCFVYVKSDVYKSNIIMLDPDVTEFTIEKIESDKTVTFSADGASNVPEPIVTGGLACIPGTVPEKSDELFCGWLYTYTFRGVEYRESVLPDSTFLACEDTVLTAEFTKLTLLERILNWILEHIINPIFGFLI